MRARAATWLALAAAACETAGPGAPSLTAVEPPAVAVPSLPAPAAVRGTGLYASAHTDLDEGDPPVVDNAWRVALDGEPLPDVTWADPTRIDVVLPAGLAPGVYDVAVTTPDGAVLALAGALEITAEPVCGDTRCEAAETTCACAADCGADCGDGCCNGGETAAGCAADCGGACDGCASGPCNEMCTADCAFGCQLDCDCDFDCPGATGTCQAHCGDTTGCQLDCTAAEACALECRGSADCTVDCSQASACDVDCGGSGACTVVCAEAGCTGLRCHGTGSCSFDCTDAAACAVECTGSAQCLLDCTGAASCAYAACDGGMTSCPDDVVVCNRACP